MRRRLILVLILVSAVVIAGAGSGAWAYWKSAGSGSGSAGTATTVAISLSAGTPSALLYPGGTTNVVLTATNPNRSPVRIGSLALNTTQGTGGLAVDAGHSACGVSALSFTTQSNGGAGWTVPAKVGSVNGTLSITLTAALAMSTAAANACQGATFTVYLGAGA
jgi:hypothetical protein